MGGEKQELENATTRGARLHSRSSDIENVALDEICLSRLPKTISQTKKTKNKKYGGGRGEGKSFRTFAPCQDFEKQVKNKKRVGLGK